MVKSILNNRKSKSDFSVSAYNFDLESTTPEYYGRANQSWILLETFCIFWMASILFMSQFTLDNLDL